ncbi:transposase domain containing protein [Trichonephila clavipes]|nr:transposase domain containing protein [Trichonephila clavipes]
MVQHLRVQRPPIHNISDLRDRCLNIWYNLSPAIYQGLMASRPRRVEAVLRAKEGDSKLLKKQYIVLPLIFGDDFNTDFDKGEKLRLVQLKSELNLDFVPGTALGQLGMVQPLM